MTFRNEKETFNKSWWIRLVLWLGAAGVSWVFPYVFIGEPQETLTALILFAGGIQMGLFEKSPLKRTGPLPRLISISAGMVLCFVGLWLTFPRAPSNLLPWQPVSLEALEDAKTNGEWVMIDFYADWCGPCRRLDSHVFGRENVAEALKTFRPLKADMSTGGNPETAAIAERFQIQGFPTVVFIGPDGEEKTGARLLGYEPAQRFIARIEALQ